jgi:hypothetical protein
MAINIKIEKKDLWILSAILVFFLGAAYVIAFNPSGTGGTPAIMGHSADELLVKNGQGAPVTLNDYIIQVNQSIANSCSFGAWTDTGIPAGGTVAEALIVDHIYIAKNNGFVVAKTTEDGSSIQGYTDKNNPPTTLLIKDTVHAGGSYGTISITMPVKKGDYWKVSGAVEKIWWVPIGA